MGLIYLTYAIVIFLWQINRVTAGKRTKKKAVVLHAAYTSIPIVLYGVVFILLIGLEELTDKAFIGEGFARTLPFAMVGGIAIAFVSTLIFALVVLAIKPGKTNAK